MEASAVTKMPDRKALQLAIKDLNTVLEPKPKLNFIASIENLSEQIIKTFNKIIGEDEAGNPIWTDQRAANLAPETVATYEALVAVQTQVLPEEPKPQYVGKGEECPGWEKNLGPKEEDASCVVCARTQECAERQQQSAVEKPTEKPKESKVALEKYGRANALVECLNSGGEFTKDELVIAVGQKYAEHGGKENAKENLWAVKTYLKPLLLIGAVVEISGKYQRVG